MDEEQISLFEEEIEEQKDKMIIYKSNESSKYKSYNVLNHLNDLLHKKGGLYSIKTETAVMNPPYSLQWNELNDERFVYGIAPKSKADYAFLLHGLHYLESNGRMAILLPHGVLFRSGKEEQIRKNLLDNKRINAVIGLPEKIFAGTSIPTAILVLTKNNEDVLFIDASKLYRKEKANNVMDFEHIEKVINLYVERKDVEKVSHLASYQEIIENGYNLNIPRYVDIYEEEVLPDGTDIIKELQEIENEINKTKEELARMAKELTSTSGSNKMFIEMMTKYFEGDL